MHSGTVDQKVQFQYAWCLVRSKYPADIRKGIMLLEDLYGRNGDSEKRDCLYYLAIGNARIKVLIILFTSIIHVFKIILLGFKKSHYKSIKLLRNVKCNVFTGILQSTSLRSSFSPN